MPRSNLRNRQREHRVTANEFRALALALPDVEERSHMGHPDFRANGRIFATLADEEAALAMAKVSPEVQEALIEGAPKVFRPCAGMWGMGGATYVELRAAQPSAVKRALHAAYDLVMASNPAKPRRRKSGPGGT